MIGKLMGGRRQHFVVEVYEDSTKAELLAEVPIIDLGIHASDGVISTGAEGLIRVAVLQLRSTQEGDWNGYHYEVSQVISKRSCDAEG